MAGRIERIDCLSAGTAPLSRDIGLRPVIIENLSAGAVYFREKAEDGVDCTAANGFCVPAGTVLDVPIAVETLSVTAAADSSDVRLLILKY